MGFLFADFETRSTVDLKKAGADVYARHPSTEVLCFGFALDDGPVDLWTPDHDVLGVSSFDPALIQDHTVVAHNTNFELLIWNEVCTKKYGWPRLHPENCLDTMAMSYSMALPGALADAAPAAGMTLQKDSAGHRIMMQLSQPRSVRDDGTAVWWTPEVSPEKFEKLYAYCKQDIEVERGLFKRLMRLTPQEQKLWLLDHKINQRGLQLNLKAMEAAIRIVTVEKKRLDLEIQKVTSGAVGGCNNSGQLKDWINVQGVVTEGVAKSDVLFLLEKPSLPENVRAALLLRQEAAKSSTAKLEAMRRGVCDDGRIRGLFQYYGAGATGRFAGRRFQPHNLPRPKLKQWAIEEIFGILENIS